MDELQDIHTNNNNIETLVIDTWFGDVVQYGMTKVTETKYHTTILQTIADNFPNIKKLVIQRGFPGKTFLDEIINSSNIPEFKKLQTITLGIYDRGGSFPFHAVSGKTAETEDEDFKINPGQSIGEVHEHVNNDKVKQQPRKANKYLQDEYTHYLKKPTSQTGCERFLELVFNEDTCTNMFPNLQILNVCAGTNLKLSNAEHVSIPPALKTIELQHLYHYEIIDVLYTIVSGDLAMKNNTLPDLYVRRLFADSEHAQTMLLADLASKCKYGVTMTDRMKEHNDTFSKVYMCTKKRDTNDIMSSSETETDGFYDAHDQSHNTSNSFIVNVNVHIQDKNQLWTCRCYSETDVMRFGLGLLHKYQMGTVGVYLESFLKKPIEMVLSGGNHYNGLINVVMKYFFPNAPNRPPDIIEGLECTPMYGQTIYHHYQVIRMLVPSGVMVMNDTQINSILNTIVPLQSKQDLRDLVKCYITDLNSLPHNVSENTNSTNRVPRPTDIHHMLLADNMLYCFRTYSTYSCICIENESVKETKHTVTDSQSNKNYSYIRMLPNCETYDIHLNMESISTEHYVRLSIEFKKDTVQSEDTLFAFDTERRVMYKLTKQTDRNNTFCMYISLIVGNVSLMGLFRAVFGRISDVFMRNQLEYKFLFFGLRGKNVCYVNKQDITTHMSSESTIKLKTESDQQGWLSSSLSVLKQLNPFGGGGSFTRKRRMTNTINNRRTRNKRRPNRWNTRRKNVRRPTHRTNRRKPQLPRY